MADKGNRDSAAEGNEPAADNMNAEQPSPRLQLQKAVVAVSPDGDGGSGDDDDGDEYEGGMGESDDDSDAETELMVLDPDHPLMKRFQDALQTLLERQEERLTEELRELAESLRARRREREDLGVELYSIQQELARCQMMMENIHDNYTQKNQQRHKQEQQLTEVRNQYKETQYTFTKEKMKKTELQGEVENLALRLFYVENAKEDIRSDIAAMRRAAEKVESEVSKAEAEKQKQDLYVDRLTDRVDKLTEEMSMYEVQLLAQAEESRAAKEALLEANMEIVAISLEKKQLFQQWTSSLIGMRRRDEAFAAMQEALHQQQQVVLSLEAEIEGYRKSIQKEQEQNEKLTLILARTERDIESARKQLVHCTARLDALKAEYTKYSRTLHETEHALNTASADKILRQNTLLALRKQIEHESREKITLEDEIMVRLRTQLTLDKAAQYSKKLAGRAREQTKTLDAQMAEVENTIAQDTLEHVSITVRLCHLTKVREKMEAGIADKNNIINRSEAGIANRNAIIERKQSLIDQENKKLDALINAAGGVEVSPLEIQINSSARLVEVLKLEITALQQQWLRQQNQLVKLCQEKDCQSCDVVKLKRQLTILSQKKIRSDNEIDGHRREMNNIERTASHIQHDVVRLNTLIHQQRNMETSLEQKNILTETDLVRSLKAAEQESIELATKVESIVEEKERLLNSLMEAEQQGMLWEKKEQLARETRAAVKGQMVQGEIKAMKTEIHRMRVRKGQLMKMQEKMIQDMEKAVTRRESIVIQGEAQSKMTKRVLTKGTFERQLAELRKKIKHTIQEANQCDIEMNELRDNQRELSKVLQGKQLNCQTLQGSADTLDDDIQHMVEMKKKNLTELVCLQQRSKYYQQVKEGRYTMLCHTDLSLQMEQGKQEQRTQALEGILEQLKQEFPHAHAMLHQAPLRFSSHSLGDEDST